MSLSSTATRVSYAGNSSTTVFAITFSFWSSSDLTVILTNDTTGVQTAWVKGSDYTVTGGSGSTGSLTATTAPATGNTLSIISALPNTQPTSLPVGGNFPSATVEQQLDQVVRQVQQLAKLVSRALVQPDGDAADIDRLPAKVTRASKFAAYDSDGDPIAAAGTSANLTPVSTFINTLLDDADAATARATLGAAATASANTFTATQTMTSVAVNEAQGANIASATTTDIGAATGNYVKVTGVVTITGLGTVQAGTRRIVEFTGALTLTHNAASLILPGAANILTVAGDVAEFVSEGSGNWRCVVFTRGAAVPPNNLGTVIVQDRKAANSAGAAINNGSYGDRELQTILLNTIASGVSVSTPNLTLPAGTYDLRAEIVYSPGGGEVVKSRLFNTTAGAVATDTGALNIVSTNGAGSGANTMNLVQTIRARITLAVSTQLKFQSQAVGAGCLAGTATNVSESEVYLQAEFTKVA